MNRRTGISLAVGAAVVVVAGALLPTLGAFAKPPTSTASTKPPTSGSSASTVFHVAATIPASLSANLPVLRLHFSAPAKAKSLPPLTTEPALATKWQQIGPNDVQAIATSALTPSTSYTINTPTSMTCTTSCTFSTTQPRIESALTNLTWEAQLLAELKYLPVTFAPSTMTSDPSQQVNGTFTWAYDNLPASLSSQWSLGTNNIILRAALMTFQSQSNIPVTGVADATTWSNLFTAVSQDKVDPAPYNYVDVSMASPETLTLYIAGQAKFHSLVNTGISVASTAPGTYPVYLRYLSTTMSGTNPDGSHYSDPGIPDVSYFNGGDALHGFIRSTYGWPQSLGCVEMPYSSAAAVFPHTPIGTLVTVHA